MCGRKALAHPAGSRFRCAISGALTFIAVVISLAARPESVLSQNSVVDQLEISEHLGWADGDDKALLTVVEFTDISCPYCASFYKGTRAELHAEFVGEGKVRWITLSYVSGLYPNSEALSIGVECAGHQDRYDDFLALAYLERAAWILAGSDDTEAILEGFANQIGLDRAAFATCQVDPLVKNRLSDIAALARNVGVRGTPTWFVDGFLVMGDLPYGFARHFITSRLEG